MLAFLFPKLYDKIRRSEQKYKVALEVLTYHNQCTDSEVEKLKNEPIPDNINEITEYETCSAFNSHTAVFYSPVRSFRNCSHFGGESK